MTVTATEIFDFTRLHPELRAERHEVFCPYFQILRRAVRQLAVMLTESQDNYDYELSVELRGNLFRLLSSPVEFSEGSFDFLTLLGSESVVRRRRGNDAAGWLHAALTAAEHLVRSGSRLREVYFSLVRESQAAGDDLRIFCHRLAEEDHQLADVPLPVIRSVAEYRESAPFDTLIKVGPLRGRGWGAVPDALVTAPRFSVLRQVVWEGSADEPEFGLDPVAPPGSHSTRNRKTSVVHHAYSGTEEEGGAVPPPENAAVDDFQILTSARRARASQQRQAYLVQIDDLHGIFYFPGSRIMSFDPMARLGEAANFRVAGTTLEEGMMVIRWLGENNDSAGQPHAEHGYFSRIWKRELQVQIRSNESGLIRRLRSAGLNLVDLHGALSHWSRDPTTVIHAPQSREHFEILLTVLGIHPGNAGSLKKWALPAWEEIARTRGLAIGQGLIGHASAESEILRSLSGIEGILRNECKKDDQFLMVLPEDCAEKGQLLFSRVLSAENGYFPPDSLMRVITEIKEAQKWRE